jgi:hypothetical protein
MTEHEMESNNNIKRIFFKESFDDNKLTNIQLQDNELTNNKKIVINELTNGTRQLVKKEKEKKMRVETHTWGLNNDDLSFETQLHLLKILCSTNTNTNANANTNAKHIAMITSHIKHKISSYKQQDILKGKFLVKDFVSFKEVIDLLNESNMKCHYCACETYLLYEIVRENKQWSLDRINNDIGHNRNNLLIACLECNLKRRRTNKDAFMFTKNLKIVRLD